MGEVITFLFVGPVLCLLGFGLLICAGVVYEILCTIKGFIVDLF